MTAQVSRGVSLTMMGHENISARYTQSLGCCFLGLELSEQKLSEFRQLVGRALNTWESPPAWMMELADMLEYAPGGKDHKQ